ncbi:HSPB1-associated protein 1 homolog [Thalassophryne amazonica]|uniref:HSPB1-associated protein 1 homolog n=1 Tax=Thalassophryne amazonica TaxID=390379 RepID=UPI001470EA5A|nr:HSPB1-associated protein 1 homolog [Thalassophryne amazonica]
MPSSDNTDNWLNPTEEGMASHHENMQYVTLAVRACAQKQKDQVQRQTRPLKRDSCGQFQKSRDFVKDAVPFNVPFGPHLIPVHCQQKDSSDSEFMRPKDLEAKSSATCELQYHQDCTVVRPQQPEHECGSGAALCRTYDSGKEAHRIIHMR